VENKYSLGNSYPYNLFNAKSNSYKSKIQPISFALELVLILNQIRKIIKK